MLDYTAFKLKKKKHWKERQVEREHLKISDAVRSEQDIGPLN